MRRLLAIAVCAGALAAVAQTVHVQAPPLNTGGTIQRHPFNGGAAVAEYLPENLAPDILWFPAFDIAPPLNRYPTAHTDTSYVYTVGLTNIRPQYATNGYGSLLWSNASSYQLTSSIPCTATAMTIAAWVWKTGNNAAVTIGASDMVSMRSGFWLLWNNGPTYARIHQNNSVYVDSQGSIPLNTLTSGWVFVAATIDGHYAGGTNAILIYTNGVRLDTKRNAGGTVTGLPLRSSMRVAQGYDGSWRWDGYIGDVFVWSRALAPSNVVNVYNTTRWRYLQ